MLKRLGALVACATLLIQPLPATAEATQETSTPVQATQSLPSKPASSSVQADAPQTTYRTSVGTKQTCGELQSRKVCTEIKPAKTEMTPDQLRSLYNSVPRAQDVIPLPAYCYEAPPDRWTITRFDGCMISSNDFNIIDVTTKERIGHIHYVTWELQFTSADITQTQQQFEMQPTLIEGVAEGSQVMGEFICAGICNILTTSFPLQSVNYGQIQKGYIAVTPGRAGAPGSPWLGVVNSRIDVRFVAPCCGISTPSYNWGELVRCDDVTPGRGPGCVIFGHIPVFEITDSTLYCCPEAARHIRQAQQSGLPGAWQSGTYLTRLTNQQKIDSNRNVACKSSYVRPPGRSCDEYPMASTWQGASTGGGTPRTNPSWCSIPQVSPGTGPTGYSVCMINAIQNEDAGRALGSFYVKNRVIDQERFQVLSN